MYEFFTDDFAGLSAVMLNWVATGVCVLIVVLLFIALLRVLRGPKLGGRKNRNARLAVTDATTIGDDRRKLVLVRRDNVEHLLLIGGPSDLVIESNIVKAAITNHRDAPQAKQLQKAPRKEPALSTPKPAKPVTAIEEKPAPIIAPTKPAAIAEPARQPTVAASPSTAPQVTAPAPSASSSQPASSPSSVAAAAAVVATPIVAGITADNVSKPVENDKSVSETTAAENTDAKRDPIEEMDALLKEISTDK